MRVTSLFSDFIGLLYPKNCLLCGDSLVKSEQHICMFCLHNLPYANVYFAKDNYVEKRFWGKVNVEKASAYLVFEKGNSVQKLIHQLKYKGQKELGNYLGKLIAIDFVAKDDKLEFDYIVPVPLHKRRYKNRGYNQSEHLALGIASVLNIPVDTKSLVRVSQKETQTRKSVYDRWQNISNVFELIDRKIFDGKHILLVDDVLTTGSTLEACVVTLQETENIKVSVLALATANH